MKIRNLALLLILAATPSLPQTGQVLGEVARSMAAARVDAGAYPSLVIAVVRGGRQEVLGLGSISDDGKRTPDGDTVYEIGSVTKTFTALPLVDAVQRGEVAPDQGAQQL